MDQTRSCCSTYWSQDTHWTGKVEVKQPACLGNPKLGEKLDPDWKPEDRFANWGRPLRSTGDEFTDWANQVRKEAVEETLEAELRELFIEEMKNGTR